MKVRVSSGTVGRVSVELNSSIPYIGSFFVRVEVGRDCVQLVHRPLSDLYQPKMIDDYECGAVGGMETRRGNQNTIVYCGHLRPHIA
jgi:hypothetical protein